MSLKAAFTAIMALVERGDVLSSGKMMREYDEATKTYLTKFNNFALNTTKWGKIGILMTQAMILSKIAITPHIITYDPLAASQLLRSKDKVSVINKLNSVKITLR